MTADLPELLKPDYYRFWVEDHVRFADLDPLGHCNNAAFGGFFESSRVALMDAVGQPVGANGKSLAIVRLLIEFRRELQRGTRVRIGARVAKIGRTSFTLHNAVFDGEECAGSGEVVGVMMDLGSRRPTELSQPVRDKLQLYM